MEVRRILNQVWDPIGIGDLPDAEGEYDNYVGEIYVMLMDREASEADIAARLYWLGTEYMGISAKEIVAERSAAAARALVACRPSFQTH